MLRTLCAMSAGLAILLTAPPAQANCGKYERKIERCEKKTERWKQNCEDRCSARAARCQRKNRDRPHALTRCDNRKYACDARCEKKAERRCVRLIKARDRCERKADARTSRKRKGKGKGKLKLIAMMSDSERKRLLRQLKNGRSGGGGPGRIIGTGTIHTGTGGGMHSKVGFGRKLRRRTGHVRLGKFKAKGFCRRGNISSVVRRRARTIRHCYESRLQVRPNIKGTLKVRWTIGSDGRVKRVASRGSLNDGGTAACVKRVIRRLRFAKPEGGVCVVEIPMVFFSRH
jgi:hypothetical protein